MKDNKITRADYKSPKNTKQVTSVLNEALAKGGDGELHIKWQKGNIVYAEEVERIDSAVEELEAFTNRT